MNRRRKQNESHKEHNNKSHKRLSIGYIIIFSVLIVMIVFYLIYVNGMLA